MSSHVSEILTMPDLIAAIGDNGVHGYVKDSDLNCDIEPKSLEEAMNMKYDSCSIPLYDKNGKTIIDSFTTNAGTVDYVAE